MHTEKKAGLHILGRTSSIHVRKVVLAAQWLGLDLSRTDAGRPFDIVKSPAHLAMNPNALVPVMDDWGFVLWESNVIVRYLCAKHSPGSLYPSDLRARFNAERWYQGVLTMPASLGVLDQPLA